MILLSFAVYTNTPPDEALKRAPKARGLYNYTYDAFRGESEQQTSRICQ